MGQTLAAIEIIGGPLPIVVYSLAAIAVVLLILRVLPRAQRWRWVVRVALAAAIGAGVGLLLCWIAGDVLNLWNVSLSRVTRLWVAAAFATFALAVLNLRKTTVRRKVIAVVAVVVVSMAGALGINANIGQYPTLGSVFQVSTFTDLEGSAFDNQRAGASAAPAGQLALWQSWQPPANMPATGVVGAVTIPATVSHFAARQALVYLPPAALVPNPPALPVLVMLSGQPGNPDHVFISGHLDTLMDSFAAQNHGLAPIVVVPDQLSAPSVNPMCVDSAIGNSATYLTVDVPAWIRANLTVQQSPSSWGIGGFSQGGTCSIQLGAAHPDLFGSIIDVSGELEPTIGSPQDTIDKGFAGNAAAYDAAKPLAILAAHAPYANTVAVFGAGALDTTFSAWTATLSAAASAAGMHTTVLSSPGTAHDWYTVRYVFEKGLPELYAQMGLTKPSA